MPRIRTIKPEFWQDEKLAPLDVIDRLVFLGLISMADDAGRLLDNVKVIDAFVFPETTETSRESLANLSRISRIRRGVTPSGQKVIQITNWGRHQRVDHANLKASLPELVTDQQPERSSREVREALATGSRDDLRPTTYDQRPTTDDDEPAASSDARRKIVTDALAEHPVYLAAFDGALRAARNPVALLAELHALHDGMPGHGGPHPWDVIGQALHEISVGGDRCTVGRLRTFCDVVARGRIEAVEGKPERPPRNFAELADREAARKAAVS